MSTVHSDIGTADLKMIKETPVQSAVRRTPRGRGLIAAVVVPALACAVFAALPGHASAAVEWNSEVHQAPTNLVTGERGTITVYVSNIGTDSSGANGWPTVAFDLPSGVSLGTPAPPHNWTCTGTTSVSCSNLFGAFFPIESNTYASGLSGGVEPLRLTVDVAPGADVGTFPLDVTLSGGGAPAPVVRSHQVSVAQATPPFGPTPGSFTAGAFDAAGDDYTQAGGHPHEATASFKLNTRFSEYVPGAAGSEYRMIQSEGNLKDVAVDLPPGFVGNPTAVPKCPDLGRIEEGTCPPNTQVGIATISPPINTTGRERMWGVYNVEPAKDHPAEFAFASPVGVVVVVPTLRSDGDWGLTATVRNVTQADTVFESSVTLWGVPADPVHDAQRCANGNYVALACVGFDEVGNPVSPDDGGPHASNAPLRPFLTNPTECDGQPVVTSMHVSSWQNPGAFQADGDADLTDPDWRSIQDAAPPVTGCDRLQFNPSIEVRPTTTTPDSPTGLEFQLNVPQNDDPDGLATAHLKDTTVVLPEGMTVNPSSAQGLNACSSSQIGLTSKSPLRFTKLEPSCPLASKIGTVDVVTPLLEEPLTGEVYLARQSDNPFDSLLAIYLVVRGPGLLVKLAGHVTADPQTGRLSTTVLENPQLPFSTLNLRLKDGPRAPLTTPATCGPKTTTGALTSWAGHSVDVVDTFVIDCPGNAGQFDPGFSAGVTQPIAGGYSPFTMRVTRNGGKDLGRINLSMPRGMLASLRHVEVCTEEQLAAATTKTGRVTQASPACPLSSQVGTTTVGSGAGPTPFYPTLPETDVSGRVFLTEAYRSTRFNLPGGIPQADYGLAIEVPAVAGPFDLGTVLVRAAIYVDPKTAEITVLSDVIPRILDGIPLNVRDVQVDIDRPNFTTTPSSCDELRIQGDIRAQDNTPALRHSRFQVGECGSLRFRPRLRLRLVGRRQVTTGRHPAVRARVRQRGIGEAAIRRAVVRLPKSLALDPDNAQALCEFEDGTKIDLENHCPEGSVVGRARALSPLLKRPLRGKVFFVKNVRVDPDTGESIRTLPMIVAALRGEVAINLYGESDVAKDGRLVNTFAQVPDAPISRFALNIRGGRNGILAVTRTRAGRINLCRRPRGHIAEADMDAHSDKRRDFNVRVKTPCRKASSKKRRAGKGRRMAGQRSHARKPRRESRRGSGR